MMEFLRGALSAIPSAATNGYALTAYALALVAYVITVWRVARNKNLLANIQKLPPKDRLSALEIETGGVRLAKGISPEQWVRSRIHRYYLLAFLATCAVAVAIAALAALKGAGYVQMLTIINNEYRQISNGAPPSGPDARQIESLLQALMARDQEGARTAFNQLSETARGAYRRAYPSAKNTLVAPEELATRASAAGGRAQASTREVEPNDDIFKANEIPLNATIAAALETPSDVDYYTSTMPGTRRDYIDVMLENDSTALAPKISIFNADKSILDSKANTTPGGDVSYAFVSQPDTRFYVSVYSYNGHGGYRLTVRARQAFDQYEPNDDILNATPIEIGKTIEANVMDPGDADYFRFETGSNAKLTAILQNRSTTLAPKISIYRTDKSVLDSKANTTPGGDLSHGFAVPPNSRFYVSVYSYNGHGRYALTIRPE